MEVNSHPISLCQLKTWTGHLAIEGISLHRDVVKNVPPYNGRLKIEDLHAILKASLEHLVAARIDRELFKCWKVPFY